MSISREIPQLFIELSHAPLQELLHTVNGVEFIMLSSSDGFELTTAVSKHNMKNYGKIAAVSSSIMAMLSAFIAEIQLEGCQTITLNAENGNVFLSAINHPQYPMVLTAVTNKDVVIGQMQYHFKQLAKQLADFPLYSTSK